LWVESFPRTTRPAIDEAIEKHSRIEVDRRLEDGGKAREGEGWWSDVQWLMPRYESVYHLVKLPKITVFRVHMAEYWLGPDGLISPLRKADDRDECHIISVVRSQGRQLRTSGRSDTNIGALGTTTETIIIEIIFSTFLVLIVNAWLNMTTFYCFNRQFYWVWFFYKLINNITFDLLVFFNAT